MRTLILTLLAVLSLAVLLPAPAVAEHRHQQRAAFRVLNVRTVRHVHYADAVQFRARLGVGSYSYQQPAQLVLREYAEPVPVPAPILREEVPVDPCPQPLILREVAPPVYHYRSYYSYGVQRQAVILRQRVFVPQSCGLRLEFRGRY